MHEYIHHFKCFALTFEHDSDTHVHVQTHGLQTLLSNDERERERVHHEAYCIRATSIVIIGKCLIEYTEKCERKNQRVI